MDLTAALLRATARRPHVLVVSAVGGDAERVAVEAAVARRGWPVAIAPAGSDLVVVAGCPGPELAAVIEQVWHQVPAPRARADVRHAAAVDPELDAAGALLADPDHQRSYAPAAPRRPGATRHYGHDDQAEHAEIADHGNGGAHHGMPGQKAEETDPVAGEGGHHCGCPKLGSPLVTGSFLTSRHPA